MYPTIAYLQMFFLKTFPIFMEKYIMPLTELHFYITFNPGRKKQWGERYVC